MGLFSMSSGNLHAFIMSHRESLDVVNMEVFE